MMSIPLFLTETHPCSYLEGELARTAFVHPVFPMETPVYAGLIAKGFRRSGDDVYQPHCDQCQACISARIPVIEFKPDRRQRRCWRKNQCVEINIEPARFDTRHFDLYRRYQHFKHPGGSMAEVDEKEYMGFLGSQWCNTVFVEFWLEQQLMAVAVVDQLGRALSAVYTFFEPKLAAHSPGVFALLWQIDYARKRGLDFVYLGYWVRQCRKMRYKEQYQPLEILTGEGWQKLERAEDGG
jgi:arginine-tRNA-protein transferase